MLCKLNLEVPNCPPDTFQKLKLSCDTVFPFTASQILRSMSGILITLLSFPFPMNIFIHLKRAVNDNFFIVNLQEKQWFQLTRHGNYWICKVIASLHCQPQLNKPSTPRTELAFFMLIIYFHHGSACFYWAFILSWNNLSPTTTIHEGR